MIISDVKTQIYNALQELPYKVIPASDNVFAEFPTITYFIENNYNQDHDNDVYGIITLVIDIWTEKSTQTYDILQEVNQALDSIGYRLTASNDVPNPDKTIYHLNTSYTTVL